MGNYVYRVPQTVDQPQHRLAPIELSAGGPRQEIPTAAFQLSFLAPVYQQAYEVDVLQQELTFYVPEVIDTTQVIDIPLLTFEQTFIAPTLSQLVYQVARPPTYVLSFLSFPSISASCQ